MSYRERERKTIIYLRDELFNDPGGGEYKNKYWEFILKNPELNLWEGIRKDAQSYFQENEITWWNDHGNAVSGHLLSSQIACLNHLFFIRKNKNVADMILKNISSDISEAVIVDDGFVEFEVIGSKNYLGEKSHTRGANSTSIDAIMVGKKKQGGNLLVMIEWKYTETYTRTNKYIPARAKIYDPLLSEAGCPIKVTNPGDLYYEPFYQLMRQTLLGWKMIQANEYGCDEYIHLHIIPMENDELKETITSPDLSGSCMSDAWKNVLVESDRYLLLTPEALIKPAAGIKGTENVFSYLSRRYWER